MPDLDIVQRQLRKHWRSPCLLIRGGHPPETVAAVIIKSLAATVKEDGGIPGFEPLYEACSKATSGQSSIKTLPDVVREVEQRFGQQLAVKVAARTALRQAVEQQYGRLLPSPLSFAGQYLRNLLDHHLFSKVNSLLVGEGKPFANIGEAQDYEARIKASAEPQLMELAKRLLSDPAATSLRAPRSSMRRRTTAELLDSPLV